MACIGPHAKELARRNTEETEIHEERTEYLIQSQKISYNYRAINIMQNNTHFLSVRADSHP